MLLKAISSFASSLALLNAVLAANTSEPLPPGQQRPWPQPSKTGKASFAIPGTNQTAETSYKLWGSLSCGKTPLILLHGGPGIPHQYLQPISLVFSDYGIPVITYDQIGCGDSTHLPERMNDTAFWTPELFMAELDNLKTSLGIHDYYLFGHSWGGMLSAQYAVTQPKGLRKLIIADSPASMATWVKVANDLRSNLPPDVQETLTRCEREGRTDSPEYEEAMNVFYQRHVCRVDPFPQELTDSLGQLAVDNTVYLTMNGPSEFFVTGSLKTWNIEAGLSKITTKTVPGGILLMNGYYDEAQDEVMEPYFKLPTARTKWIRFGLSSHTGQLEETEKYVKALGTFLTQE